MKPDMNCAFQPGVVKPLVYQFESFDGFFLIPERLDHAVPGQHLFHVAVELAEGFLLGHEIFLRRLAISMVARNESGRVTIVIRVSIGLMTSIMTSGAGYADDGGNSCGSPCCSVLFMLSTSLVVLLMISPCVRVSKYFSGSRDSLSSTSLRRVYYPLRYHQTASAGECR